MPTRSNPAAPGLRPSNSAAEGGAEKTPEDDESLVYLDGTWEEWSQSGGHEEQKESQSDVALGVDQKRRCGFVVLL